MLHHSPPAPTLGLLLLLLLLLLQRIVLCCLRCSCACNPCYLRLC